MSFIHRFSDPTQNGNAFEMFENPSHNPFNENASQVNTVYITYPFFSLGSFFFPSFIVPRSCSPKSELHRDACFHPPTRTRRSSTPHLPVPHAAPRPPPAGTPRSSAPPEKKTSRWSSRCAAAGSSDQVWLKGGEPTRR